MTFVWLYRTMFWDREAGTHGSWASKATQVCIVCPSLSKDYCTGNKMQPQTCVFVCVCVDFKCRGMYISFFSCACKHWICMCQPACCLCWPEDSCWLRSPWVISGSCRVEWQQRAISMVNQLKKKITGANIVWNDTFTSLVLLIQATRNVIISCRKKKYVDQSELCHCNFTNQLKLLNPALNRGQFKKEREI